EPRHGVKARAERAIAVLTTVLIFVDPIRLTVEIIVEAEEVPGRNCVRIFPRKPHRHPVYRYPGAGSEEMACVGMDKWSGIPIHFLRVQSIGNIAKPVCVP